MICRYYAKRRGGVWRFGRGGGGGGPLTRSRHKHNSFLFAIGQIINDLPGGQINNSTSVRIDCKGIPHATMMRMTPSITTDGKPDCLAVKTDFMIPVERKDNRLELS